MSYLDKLLEGVMVEWKPLGEFADYEQPTKYLVNSNNYNENFPTPVLTAGKTFILGYTDETEGIYKASENPVIIFDDFTTANKWVDFDFKAKSSAMKMLTSKDETKVLLKYIFYWLNTLPCELVDGDHKRQWISNYSLKEIPIPSPESPQKSLEIQKKIVRILDTFTELTAELTTELLKRRVQYKYYSTILFDKARKSDIYSIDEVCHVEKGMTPIQKAIPGKYPLVVTTTERKSCETYQFNAKAVCIPLVSSRGHGVASLNHVYYQEGKFALGNILCAIIPKNEEQVYSKYLYYYFEQTKEYTLVPLMNGGANVALRKNDIEKVKVPIPSLEEQYHIVSILDKFDMLTNSNSKGLPREIELRKKQYEYYRDLLLTFPKNNIEL